MLELFHRGGPVMWLLLAAAVIGMTFIIERFITFMRAGVNPKKFVAQVLSALRKGGVEEAIAVCNKSPSPVARILAAGLSKKDAGRRTADKKAAIEDAIAIAGASELAFLDRGMLVLAAVATVAPLIGFLGTVVGMIQAFDAIAIAGTMEPTLVAQGISVALITTASGLAIAVPVAAFHVFFTSRVNTYTRNMEEASNTLVEALIGEETE